MELIIFSCLFVAIFGSVVIYYIKLFNQMNMYISKIKQTESVIDEALRTKYDIFTNIDLISQKLAKSKKNFFKGINKITDDNISSFDFDRKLVSYELILAQLKLDYETINDSEDIKNLEFDLFEINEKLDASKIYYNRNTHLLNSLIKKFPYNLVASIHKIKIRSFFDGKDLEDDIVDDFKI